MLISIALLSKLIDSEGNVITPSPITTGPITSLKDCFSDPNNVAGSAATLDCIPLIFFNVLKFIFGFSAIVALFFVFFAGFKFLTSGGDAKQVEGARKTLTYAIIGLIVVLLSFAILKVISAVTGVGCILNFGFNIC